MDVSSATAAAAQSSKSAKSLAGNYDTFLKLLTAQLQHQDPMKPMDPSEFTQQLVQYSSVEQGIYTNKNLETLIALQKTSGLNTATSYIGRDVTATTDKAALTNGQAEWSYELPGDANQAILTVKDSSGKTVYTAAGPIAKGANSVTWDGRMTGGGTAPDGVYQLVVSATDAGGRQLDAVLKSSGRVTGAEMTNGSVMLLVNGLKLKIEDLQSVRESTV